MCTTLAVAVVTRDGPLAGAHSLTGLVRSLPCYLTFCLVVAAAAPVAGLGAIALGLGRASSLPARRGEAYR